jgi:acyl dehydratase
MPNAIVATLQPGCNLIGSFARSDIDNPRLAGVLVLNKMVQLLFVLIFQQNTVTDIGPVKAGDELCGGRQFKFIKNVFAGDRIRGCR